MGRPVCQGGAQARVCVRAVPGIPTAEKETCCPFNVLPSEGQV